MSSQNMQQQIQQQKTVQMFDAGFKTFFPTTAEDNQKYVQSRHHQRSKTTNAQQECGYEKSAAMSRFFNDECDDISEITNVFHNKKENLKLH